MVTIKCKHIAFSDIEAILFDKNGTLEDSEAYLRTLGQKAARMIDAQIPGIGEPLLMAFGINGDFLDPAGLISVASRRETEVAAAAYIAENFGGSEGGDGCETSSLFGGNGASGIYGGGGRAAASVGGIPATAPGAGGGGGYSQNLPGGNGADGALRYRFLS